MNNLASKLEAYLAADPIFRQVYDYTKTQFDAAPQLYAHNFEHARRDAMNAIAIGEPEGANMHIALCAAITHDIGYLTKAHHSVHGEVGANDLPRYLAAGGLDLPADEVGQIAACIRTHKGAMSGVEPATLEAKVVADADHLDKYGPVGAYQQALSLSEFGYSGPEIIQRYTRRRDNLPFFTATASKLAEPLRAFSRDYRQALIAAYRPYLKDQPQEPIS